jgi:hypothetical protein
MKVKRKDQTRFRFGSEGCEVAGSVLNPTHYPCWRTYVSMQVPQLGFALANKLFSLLITSRKSWPSGRIKNTKTPWLVFLFSCISSFIEVIKAKYLFPPPFAILALDYDLIILAILFVAKSKALTTCELFGGEEEFGFFLRCFFMEYQHHMK